MSDQGYIVSTDCGGTFVDCAVLDSAGRLFIGKSPTTADQPSKGILGAVAAAAEAAGVGFNELLHNCRLFLNGTTVTTNAMVQRRGARTGLITTSGFEDTLIIGRVKARWAGLSEPEVLDFGKVTRPAPVVPMELVRGVRERIDYAGEVVRPLDIQEVERHLDELVSLGIDSLAICLLWSFRNPFHEAQIAALARAKYPKLYVIASHELVPAMGEYERCNTTAVEGYLGPLLSAYLSDIEKSLKAVGYPGELLVMQSIGGLAPAVGLTHAAVSTLHSGPAGGIIAAQKLGEVLQKPNIITADMGGTTFDVGLVVDGMPQTAQISVIERNLLLVPSVEAISIGAGGGSLAWLDSAQALHVGPQSQGAYPGPACYGRGGDKPTVTDADVVLGYINPDTFLGGRMRLRADLAREAIRRHVADPMGITVEAAAQAIYDIVNAHMADLIRSVSIGKGHDPRDFAMVAFGGCGPTHASGFGPEAQIEEVIVPAAATVFSALGIAQSEIKHFYSETCTRPLSSAAEISPGIAEELEEKFNALAERARRQFERDGVPAAQRTFRRSLDLRYRKQVHELTIPLRISGPLSTAALLTLVDDFHRAYERLYGQGSSMSAATIDIVTLRLEGVAQTPFPTRSQKYRLESEAPTGAILGERKVWWRERNGYVATPTYQMEKLRPGNVIFGPAVIESYGTTIPLHPGQRASVDEWLNVNLTLPVQTGATPARPTHVAKEMALESGANR